jgi:hypothetical protein
MEMAEDFEEAISVRGGWKTVLPLSQIGPSPFEASISVILYHSELNASSGRIVTEIFIVSTVVEVKHAPAAD